MVFVETEGEVKKVLRYLEIISHRILLTEENGTRRESMVAILRVLTLSVRAVRREPSDDRSSSSSFFFLLLHLHAPSKFGGARMFRKDVPTLLRSYFISHTIVNVQQSRTINSR